MSADPRLHYLASTLSDLFGDAALTKSSLQSQLIDDHSVNAFCNDPNTVLLCTTVNTSTGRLSFTNAATATVAGNVASNDKYEVESKESITDRSALREIHILKRARTALSPDSHVSSQLMVVSMLDNPLYSLYLAMHNVYGPKLSMTSDIHPNIQRQFLELESQIHATLITQSRSSMTTMIGKGDLIGKGDVSVSVSSVEDEVTYWTELLKTSTQTEQAELFLPHLQSLSDKVSVLVQPTSTNTSSNTVDVYKLIDDIADSLHDLWTEDIDDPSLAYQQPRMDCLFAIINELLASYIRTVLVQCEPFTDPYLTVRETLNSCHSQCEAWLTTKHDLTRQNEWRARWNHNTGSDSDSESVDSLTLLRDRIEAILSIRSLYEELLALLPANTASSLSSLLEPFHDTDYFHPTPFSAGAWHQAELLWNRSLTPYEQNAALTLKQRIMALTSQPSLLLNEFRLYPELWTRPSVMAALESERATVMHQMIGMIEAIQAEFDSHERDGDTVSAQLSQALNVSVFTANLIWGHQLVAKATNIHSIVTRVFNYNDSEASADSQLIKKFSTHCQTIITKLNKHNRALFNSWQSALLESLANKDSPLHLSTQGAALMELDLRHEGELVVHYSGDLVKLIKEARHVTEMGYKLDSQLVKTITIAERYYKYGLKLQQIASFYNHMHEQILTSQLGLLINEAQSFESVVKIKNGWNWSKIDECDAYMEKLQSAAETLTTRNRKLRSLHFSLSDVLLSLTSQFDLFANNLLLTRNKDRLNDYVSKMRTVMAKEDRGGHSGAGNKWRHHWDQQFYKVFHLYYRALLFQYMGQTTTTAAQPQPFTGELNLAIDLVFVRRRLSFRPPLEEIRSQYYRSIKKFLELPKQFQGFADINSPGPQSVYHFMPERNSDGLSHIYSVCESLFGQLDSLCLQYEPWCALGTVDVDHFIESNAAHLATIADYEHQFKILKAKKKEFEKLPDVIRIGCFSVSMAAFKNTVEDLMSRWSDGLLLSLKKSCNDSIATVNTFLKHSAAVFAALPTTMSEMETSRQSFQSLLEERAGIESHMSSIGAKNEFLRAMTNIVNTEHTDLRHRWEEFLSHTEAFDIYLAEQQENIKDELVRTSDNQRLTIESFASKWQALKPVVDGELTSDSAIKIIGEMEAWRTEWLQHKQAAEATIAQCQALGLPLPQFPVNDSLEVEISQAYDSWAFFSQYRQELETMGSELWVMFRVKLSSFDDFTQAWTKKLKMRGSRDRVYDYLMKQLKFNRDLFPVLRKVTGEFYEKEHWKLLFSYVGLPNTLTTATLTFQHLIDRNEKLLEKNKEITALTARAQGEVTIRDAVQELKLWSENAQFALLSLDQYSVTVIKDWKELFTGLSDQVALAASLKESPYYHLFEAEARQIELRLNTTDSVLHALQTIQRKWVYLFPIFNKGALPSEQGRFGRINSEFRSIMEEIKGNPQVMSIANILHISDTVTTMSDQLDKCQRALNDFLEEKRSKFPRFYFIGDDDLLEILGQSANPTVIQAHLKKLFQGITRVEFDSTNETIMAILSSENERVVLDAPVRVSEDVEGWLNALCISVEGTLQHQLVECLSKGADLVQQSSQILCLAEQITFTRRVESILSDGGSNVGTSLQSLMADCTKQLQSYTTHDCGDDRLLELKLKSLVFDLIHNIDVIRQLIDSGVQSLDHWIWQKQLRFYLNAKQLAIIRMVDAEFDYTYEYCGNVEKLVHTPLSDKCYLVLTQGMNLGYGGCPFGPAGTGKTESVKALAAAFGRQCLVFNCDEGIDFQAMGRIFMGLVKSGAWGCFDEFNRLKEDQLSAVSQQIQVIQAALKQKQSHCSLLGHTITVNFNAAIFVTMNPVSKEYGGRSKLPHNLKQLFRDVAMAAPDISLICEVILLAAGFNHAQRLGRQIAEIFELSRQLLSPQRHYDWGLRALKTILRHADQLIHSEKRAKKTLTLTAEQETALVIGALRMNTLSKLTFADSVKFNDLINDLFPKTEVSEIDYSKLEAAINDAISQLKLERVQKQVTKIIQLYEACHQRMGVVLVGPSGAGKSVMLEILALAQSKLGHRIVQHVMNPKSMDRTKLLGFMDYDTREFKDGTLIAASRAVMRESADTHSWIVCDGDIDPVWVESLNSVLDDNHLLTMPNGERIKFGSNVNFIFETHDLSFASPATVSRMGMIFLSDEDVDIAALVKSWIGKQVPDRQARLSGWMEEFFYQSLQWVCDAGADVVKRTKIGLVQTGLSHLREAQTKAEFSVGLVRGLGSNLDLAQCTNFAKQVFGWSNERPADPKSPLDSYYDANTQTMASYVNLDTLHKESDDESSDTTLSFRSPPLIFTADIQRHLSYIQPWLASGEPFLLVGPEGAGKTLMLEHAFAALKGASRTTINCSAETQSSHVIAKLNESCQSLITAKGRTLRPKEGDRLVLFLKDLNLPKADQYDTIQMIAFLQQLITHRGFYDDALEWVNIEGIQIVATMNPVTAVGRSQLSTRFTATVHVASVSYPNHEALIHIYSAFLTRVMAATPKLSDNQWRESNNVRRLCQCMVDVYEKMRAKLSVDDHRHYLFTPRDLTQWVFGLMRYDLANENLLDVLVYEAKRLFSDRLVDSATARAFDSILSAALRQQLKYDIKAEPVYYSSMAALAEATSTVVEATAASKELGPPLERIKAEDFQEILSEGLRSYERDYKTLNLLFFPEILDHFAFEDRVLSRPGGSLLLIGDVGVGRRSSITLLCHMQHLHLFTPSLSPKYDLKQFRTELKDLMKRAGVDGQSSVLFLEDYQIAEECFLEDINSLLSAGEIAGLYQSNEMDSLLAPLKEEYLSSGHTSGARTLYEFFVSRVRSNLHVVLAMDPAHPRFHARCDANPALYARMSIIWMGHWTNEALVAIPSMKLGSSILNAVLSNGQRIDQQRVLDHLLAIHNSCLTNSKAVTGVTPLKYVAFLSTYAKIFQSNQSQLLTQKSHLSAGLLKLQEAAASVDVLSKDAAAKQALVSKKQQEADAALEAITARMSQASERKVEVEQLQQTLGQEEEKLNIEKVQIAQQLTEVEPILAEAKQAVGGIKKDNLNEIRAFRMPPQPISHVLSGVLGLLKQEDTSWANMKKFLASPSVKDEIMNFDASKLDRGTREKVQKIIDGSNGSFEAAVITRVNVAAAPLAKWCLACVRFSKVFDEVKPLQDRLDAANAKLNSARERLKQCTTDLKTLDSDVKKLKANFAKTTGEAETLKLALQKTSDTLSAAQSLLGKLSREHERWDGQVKGLSSQLDSLIHHAMLAAGFITYLGGCDEDTRALMLKQWSDRMFANDSSTGHFDFMTFMATESTFLTWKSEGLSSDALSMQNGLVIKSTEQIPYVLDPNGVAVKWLTNHLSTSGVSVEVVQAHDPKLINTIELSVRFGKTLLITEVDGVMPTLYPLIRKDLVRAGPRSVVQIGDKQVDYHDNFKLFLITRQAQSTLTSDALALLNSVNFTVTRSGLEGQLLGLTLAHEKPELETQKSSLLAQEDALKLQIAALEKLLLNALASSEGNLLENKALIESLNQTKSQSLEISASLARSKEIATDLDRQREVYRPIAAAGSSQFFLLQQLKTINNMYDFALPTFTQLFEANLARAVGANKDNGTEFIASLVESLKLSVFNYVSRSLFKADRLMFAMHLLHSLYPQQFGANEWEFFIDALVIDQSTDSAGATMSMPKHFSSDRTVAFQALAAAFPALLRSLRLSDENAWGRWSRDPRAENEFPVIAGEKAPTVFQKLLVMKSLRPDRLQSAINQFACELIGVSNLSPPPLNLAQLCEEIDQKQPILFICEGGADPTADLEEFASQSIGRGQLVQCAMGSGQTDAAMAMVLTAAKEGQWVLLKNVHLCCAWAAQLEKTVRTLSLDTSLHKQFRLFLTTESHPAFPPILLQSSCKISFEAPPGIKQNLLRSYQSWTPSFISQGSIARAQLLFVLAWFHAIAQERRTYIPQGWTKFYEFSTADLRSGADIIDSLMHRLESKTAQFELSQVPWTTIWGLFKFAIYGGRIDIAQDERVLVTYLRKFFHKDILHSTTNNKAGDRKLTPGLLLPSTVQHGEYLALIHRLPDNDSPVLFSLPDNIDAAVQQNQSAAVIGALRKLAVSSGAIERFDRETWKSVLAPICALWDKLINGGNATGGMTSRKTAAGAGLLAKPSKLNKPEEQYSPLESFIVNESVKAHSIMMIVNTTISGLSALLFGNGALTDDLFVDGASLLIGQVPWWRWCKQWQSPTEDVATFLKAVSMRTQAIGQWLERANRGEMIDGPIKLEQLFTPKVFLNALRQQTARECQQPIDAFKLVCAFDCALMPRSVKIVVALDGLQLQGCGFTNNLLSPLQADSPNFVALPLCYLAYIHRSDPEPYPDGQSALSLPVYFASNREQLIADLRLPCKGQLDRWTLTGAAVFLSSVL